MNLKNIIIILLLISVVGSGISTAYYKSENIKSKATLSRLTNELKIERDKETYKSNEKKEKELTDKISRQGKELEEMYKKYNDLKVKKIPSKLTIRKELKNVKNTKDLCKEFASIGYPICRDTTPNKCP